MINLPPGALPPPLAVTVRHVACLGGALSANVVVCGTASVTLATQGHRAVEHTPEMGAGIP